jgi:hypothetical protein
METVAGKVGLTVVIGITQSAGGSTEFLNAAALVHRDKGKISKCRWIIDER